MQRAVQFWGCFGPLSGVPGWEPTGFALFWGILLKWGLRERAILGSLRDPYSGVPGWEPTGFALFWAILLKWGLRERAILGVSPRPLFWGTWLGAYWFCTVLGYPAEMGSAGRGHSGGPVVAVPACTGVRVRGHIGTDTYVRVRGHWCSA